MSIERYTDRCGAPETTGPAVVGNIPWAPPNDVGSNGSHV